VEGAAGDKGQAAAAAGINKGSGKESKGTADSAASAGETDKEETAAAAAATAEKKAEEEAAADLNPESGLPPNPRYTALLTGKLAEMLGDIAQGGESGGWKKNTKGEKAKIAISTKVGDDGVMCAKGQGLIDAPIGY
jgi:hypothetical protein